MSDENPIKQWNAKRKAVVVTENLQRQASVAEMACQRDLTVSEIEGWIDETL